MMIQPPSNNIPTDPTKTAHDRHDRCLIAALAANDLDGGERREAETLVVECQSCADLLADLRAIAAATTALPPVAMPPAFDFRLTEADAQRVGARGWRRVLQELAGRRFSFTRPLAVGLTTLGLIGVISASLPGGIGGGTATVLSTVGNAVG